MALARADSPVDVPLFSYDKPSSDVFPDGIKTSGQTPPNYDQLKPYDAFPKEITGKTVWHAEEFKNNPEKWTHRFTEEEVQVVENYMFSHTGASDVPDQADVPDSARSS